MNFETMKYAELQKLAKQFGLKGNMKADKLLKAVKLHYEQKTKAEQHDGMDNNDVSEADQAPEHNNQNHDKACEEEISGTVAFVNTRRGKADRTKRKVSDAALTLELDATSPAKMVECVAEVTDSSNSRKAKRSKVLSKMTDKAEPPLPEKTQSSDDPPLLSETEKANNRVRPGKIPRLQQKLKPVTPNFKKLHEAHFNKMESIDCYMQRKNKQMETLRNPEKETKKKNVGVLSPLPVNRTAEGQRRHTVLSATKAPANKLRRKEEVPFRPSVLSTRRINVRFSEAPQDNKKSAVKSQALSPCVSCSTPLRPHAKTTSSVKKIPAPFLFTGNTSTSVTPGTQKKPSFDLKTSLSRTLAYQPHKGKLKPFGETKENPRADKSLVSNPHQENYKQHKVQSRDDRRTKRAEGRKQKKEHLLGARRGLVMM